MKKIKGYRTRIMLTNWERAREKQRNCLKIEKAIRLRRAGTLWVWICFSEHYWIVTKTKRECFAGGFHALKSSYCHCLVDARYSWTQRLFSPSARFIIALLCAHMLSFSIFSNVCCVCCVQKENRCMFYIFLAWVSNRISFEMSKIDSVENRQHKRLPYWIHKSDNLFISKDSPIFISITFYVYAAVQLTGYTFLCAGAQVWCVSFPAIRLMNSN